jgi:L-lysine exporter family protein LysE/ArgO
LRPVFANPAAWRILEGVIALVMWLIALTLLTGG